MATAGDGVAPSESAGAGEKLEKSSTGMSLDEGENTANIFSTIGISELEETLTFSRSKMEHPAATMENLPDELLINIFIRLLAKQLAQMRSVSECWNALLSNPSFVKSHLHRFIHNNNRQILLVFPGHRPITQYSCNSTNLEPSNFIKHTPVDVDLPMMVIGSVNGLICLSEISYSNIHIWNPSLSAVSTIPPPRSMPTGPKYETSVLFGFDPKTDDYKLVKISGVLDSKYNVKEWLQVEVYSMRNRSWEFITQPFPSHITGIFSFDYLCVDGHDGYLHWQDTLKVWPTSTIVAFDLSSETFHEIPLPHSMLDSYLRNFHLGVLGGKLCVMSLCRDGSWEVWVMEEYGFPESWAKRHVLSQFNDVVLLFGFTSRNELLFLDKASRHVLYDPVANKTKKAPVQQVYGIVEYVDSLAWI